MDEPRYRIGELAAATGVTVRALRHYDALGLVAPDERTAAGHRLYGPAAVERLFRVLALRRVGLALDRIEAVLREEAPLEAVLREQLARTQERLELERRLHGRLTRLLDGLAAGRAAGTEDLLDTIEVMTMIERYYTPEQLEQLEARRRQLGEEGMQRVQRDWAALFAEARRLRDAGTDPADARVQALADRADTLIEAFTGGDPGIRASLQRMYDEQGPQRASRGMADPELLAYLQAAREARGG